MRDRTTPFESEAVLEVTMVTMLKNRNGMSLLAHSATMLVLFKNGWVTSANPLEAELTPAGRRKAELVDLGPVWQTEAA